MNKLIIVLGAIALIAVGSTLFTPKTQSLRQNAPGQLTKEVIEQWIEYKKSFPRTFTSSDYEVYRMKIFALNLEKIQATNSQNLGYTLALNNMADLTTEEFKKFYLGLKPELKQRANNQHVNNGLTLGDVDWRTKGAVQTVKDQGQCGSCWAFSAVGSMESESFLSSGKLGNFAEQQLVDCSTSYGNYGCNGGLMDYAFEFVIDNGITDEGSYPYTARDGSCKTKTGAFKISKYTDVAAGSTSDLQNAITQQPTSVAVDAESWQFYSGGVFSNCGTSLDHGVLAVGFTSEAWIVKNSWGTSWGETGYIRLAMGNTCGIANMASYPVV